MVPVGADAAAVVAPPPAAILGRMALDVRDTISPPARPRLAVLTFDDGPYPVETPALAAALSALHAPATFFLIGNDAMRQPAIARRLAANGFEIGDHSFSHPEMPSLSARAQRMEIEGGARALSDAAGVRVIGFRPPHGSYDADTLAAASAAGQTVVLWDVDPGDWRTLEVDDIVASTVAQARAPAVILLHDGKDATIEALPRIVAAYRSAGFEFVSFSELLRRVPPDQLNDPVKVRL